MVRVGTETSGRLKPEYGVPQGTILGPMAFNLFTEKPKFKF